MRGKYLSTKCTPFYESKHIIPASPVNTKTFDAISLESQLPLNKNMMKMHSKASSEGASRILD